MNGKTLCIVTALICLVITGCSGAFVKVSLRGYPSPVMVSPIVRIGDTAPPNVALPEFSRFSGESSFSAGGGGGSHREGNYMVYETRTATAYSDSIAYEISKGTGGRTDLLVFVDTLSAGSWLHCSLAWAHNHWVSVKGRLLDPKALQRRAEK